MKQLFGYKINPSLAFAFLVAFALLLTLLFWKNQNPPTQVQLDNQPAQTQKTP